MGVVRDVTIDQLTQAVTGISTSGISDSTGQAINTTLGTLGKDTSLQDIKDSINALANVLKPTASDIPYDSNISVKGKIDDIGTYWSVDWTATASSAINIILTEQKTLAKGVYIAIGNAPTLSINDFAVAIRANKTINAKSVYNMISTLSSLVFTFEILSDDTNVYISSASSTSVTFSNLTNGGLRIVKLK